MAFIVISPTENIHTIATLAGGTSSRYADGKLIVDDITQQQLDEALATYNADPELYSLQPAREGRANKISKKAFSYIESVYPSFRRELFIALAEEARNLGLTNRANYINQMLTWVKTVVSSVLALEDQINAASTVEEIRSVDFDPTPFVDADPQITVRNALAIED